MEKLKLREKSLNAGGGHPEDMTSGWTSSRTWAVGGSSSPPLSLECALHSLFPHKGHFMGAALSEFCVLRWLVCDWTQWRPLCKRDYGSWVQRSIRLIHKCPSLQHLPPSNVEWPASFFVLLVLRPVSPRNQHWSWDRWKRCIVKKNHIFLLRASSFCVIFYLFSMEFSPSSTLLHPEG